MRFLLDTNIVIPLLNGKNEGVAAAVRRRALDEVGLSSVVMYELFYGAYKSGRVEHSLLSLRELPFDTVPFDREDAAEAGRIRAALAAKGEMIGPYDVMIAGQALRRDLTVVTANLREFARVPGLRCEDWSR